MAGAEAHGQRTLEFPASIHFEAGLGTVLVHVGRVKRSGQQCVTIHLAADGYPEVIELHGISPDATEPDNDTVWIGMRNAAAALSLDVKTVRKLAASGKLRAEMVAGQWITTPAWLAEFASGRKGRGRPRRAAAEEAVEKRA